MFGVTQSSSVGTWLMSNSLTNGERTRVVEEVKPGPDMVNSKLEELLGKIAIEEYKRK